MRIWLYLKETYSNEAENTTPLWGEICLPETKGYGTLYSEVINPTYIRLTSGLGTLSLLMPDSQTKDARSCHLFKIKSTGQKNIKKCVIYL